MEAYLHLQLSGTIGLDKSGESRYRVAPWGRVTASSAYAVLYAATPAVHGRPNFAAWRPAPRAMTRLSPRLAACTYL